MSDEEEDPKKKGNALPLWGNTQTMNINNLIITNIQSSAYFKNDLFKLKTFHEVIDEIYYKVEHLEPWERGSRKTHGQVGMCGGVRGVGAGGIVSSAYCLLFKLFTLKLTERQLLQLINHRDSPYIRGLGFMFIRYCQHPNTFWEWFEPYMEDDEEIDPKAGSGSLMTIGQMIRSFLLKPDWYSTLFPRIPVPIHKVINERLRELNLDDERKVYADDGVAEGSRDDREGGKNDNQEADADNNGDRKGFGEAERRSQKQEGGSSSSSRRRSRERSRDRSTSRRKSRERSTSRSKRSSRERSRDRHTKSESRKRSRSKERRRSRSREKKHRHHRDERDERSRDRDKRDSSDNKERSKKTRDRSRERHRDRRRSRSHSKSRR